MDRESICSKEKTVVKHCLETVSALFWVLFLLGLPVICISLFLYISLFTNYYLVSLIYVCWIYYDRKTPHQGGRRFQFIMNLQCWKHAADYFPLKLVKKCNLAHNKNYLFCVFPHGIIATGACLHFSTNATNFSGVLPNFKSYLGTIDSNWKVPIFRELLLGMGMVSASRESIQFILKSKEKGKIVVIMVGGAAETFYARPKQYTFVVQNRKGFVRMALLSGCPLVPVISFGENDIFDQLPNPPGSMVFASQMAVKRITGYTPCLPIGRWFTAVPKKCPITTVVGAPIDVPCVPEPSQELIDKYHQKFITSLIDLFNETKTQFIVNSEETNPITI